MQAGGGSKSYTCITKEGTGNYEAASLGRYSGQSLNLLYIETPSIKKPVLYHKILNIRLFSRVLRLQNHGLGKSDVEVGPTR